MKTALLLLTLIASPLAYPAEGNDAPPPPPPAQHAERPPQPDTTVCKDKNAGATVEIKTPDGRTLKGKCLLAFIPDRPAGGPPGGGKTQP